jgi:hypothetical protein
VSFTPRIVRCSEDADEGKGVGLDADSSVRSGLCTSQQLGGFITSLPVDVHLNTTSIYTTPLKFDPSSFPSETSPAIPDPEPIPISSPEDDPGLEAPDDLEEEGQANEEATEDTPTPLDEFNDKRQWDLIEGITNGLKSSSAQDGGDEAGNGDGQGGVVYVVPAYTGPIHYQVPKTGYYCVGEFLSPLHPNFCLAHVLQERRN